MYITVFTATYNRAHTLPRLYESLRCQSYENFEWLIVDDGSSDNTEELVQGFLGEKPPFSIVYVRNKHGGKHRAINKGLDVAKGELFFLVDSDDYLTKHALETVIKWVKEIPDRTECAGLCGMMSDEHGSPIGTQFEQDFLYMTLIDMMKLGITGDRANIFFTEIFKKYKYPEFPGEWHIAPGVPHVRMAKDGYKLLFFNEIIYIAEYMQDGLTRMGDKKIIDNFKGYTLRTRELLELDIGARRKVEIMGKYTYLGRRLGLSYREICENVSINSIQAFIFGTLASLFYSIRGESL